MTRVMDFVVATTVVVLLCVAAFGVGVYLGTTTDDRVDPDGETRLTANDVGWCDYRVEIVYPEESVESYHMHCIPDDSVVRVNSTDVP